MEVFWIFKPIVNYYCLLLIKLYFSNKSKSQHDKSLNKSYELLKFEFSVWDYTF